MAGFDSPTTGWFSPPADNFSFADSHAEVFKWRDPRTLAIKEINTVVTANNPDLKKLQAAVATKN